MRPDGSELPFDVDPARKRNLLAGLDAIGLTLEREAAISAFEQRRSEETPWLDGATTRVPKLFPVSNDELGMPVNPELNTPDTADWAAEAQGKRAAAAG